MHRDPHHHDELLGQHGMELPELPIPRPVEQLPDPASAPAPAPEPGPEPSPVDEAEQPDARRFSWEIAARLTAGMLANPARTHMSVKDAMAMFDQFLHEMDAYGRLTSKQPPSSDAATRRQAHGDYFFQPPAASDAAATPAPPPLQPRQAPQRPRPLGGMEAMPRLPYQRPAGDDRAA